jgi:hypothetical protein
MEGGGEILPHGSDAAEREGEGRSLGHGAHAFIFLVRVEGTRRWFTTCLIMKYLLSKSWTLCRLLTSKLASLDLDPQVRPPAQERTSNSQRHQIYATLPIAEIPRVSLDVPGLLPFGTGCVFVRHIASTYCRRNSLWGASALCLFQAGEDLVWTGHAGCGVACCDNDGYVSGIED